MQCIFVCTALYCGIGDRELGILLVLAAIIDNMGNSVSSREPDITIVLNGQHGWTLHRSGRTELDDVAHSDYADEQEKVYLTHQAANDFKDRFSEHNIDWVGENLSIG